MTTQSAIYEFGPFRLDVAKRTLCKDGQARNVGELVFDCLVFLVENSGRAVPKEKMFEAFWPGQSGDRDARLKDLIRRLCGDAVLEDADRDNPKYVVRKQNYVTFIAEIKKSTVGYAEPESSHADRTTMPLEHCEPSSVDSTLPVRLLELYYPDADLRAQNLFRYSYTVNGHMVTTNMATSAPWLELALPVTELDFNKFPIVQADPLWPRVPPEVIARLRKELDERGIQFRNRPIYCLRSFTPHSPETIAAFSTATYVDYKLELGRLEEETAKALAETSPELALANRASKLPLREKHLRDSKLMAEYGSRLCAGGTNILLAFRTPGRDDFMFFVKRRSKGVSTGRRIFSLIPSGMHQPTVPANALEESSVAATVYREMDEELFGGKEPEETAKHLAPRLCMTKPHLAWFSDNPGAFTLEIVSFGLNLMDGTFEFGVLLAINDESYWQRFRAEILANDEFDDTVTAPFYTLDTDRLASIMADPQCADTSRIALVEGVRRLQQLAPGRVGLLKIEIVK